MLHAEFELDSFRQKMDEQGMAVAENQETSLKSRRRLAETTRGVTCKGNAVDACKGHRAQDMCCLQSSGRVPQQSSIATREPC